MPTKDQVTKIQCECYNPCQQSYIKCLPVYQCVFIGSDGHSRRYTGQLKDGAMCGFGFLQILTGQQKGWKHVGHFKNSLFHGKGTHTSSNGVVVEGMWCNDVLNGDITVTKPDGSSNNYSYLNGRKIQSVMANYS